MGDGRARLADAAGCQHRHTAVELGQEISSVATEKARAQRAGDTERVTALSEDLRVLKAGLARQYRECEHSPDGDRNRHNKGVDPAARKEALAGEPAPVDAVRVDAAIERAHSALSTTEERVERHAAQAYQDREREQRRQARINERHATQPCTDSSSAGRGAQADLEV